MYVLRPSRHRRQNVHTTLRRRPGRLLNVLAYLKMGHGVKCVNLVFSVIGSFSTNKICSKVQAVFFFFTNFNSSVCPLHLWEFSKETSFVKKHVCFKKYYLEFLMETGMRNFQKPPNFWSFYISQCQFPNVFFFK